MTLDEARQHALDVLRQHEAARAKTADEEVREFALQLPDETILTTGVLLLDLRRVERERDDAAAAGAAAVVRAVRAEVERDEARTTIRTVQDALGDPGLCLAERAARIASILQEYAKGGA